MSWMTLDVFKRDKISVGHASAGVQSQWKALITKRISNTTAKTQTFAPNAHVLYSWLVQWGLADRTDGLTHELP